jgi:hypothetical protein
LIDHLEGCIVSEEVLETVPSTPENILTSGARPAERSKLGPGHLDECYLDASGAGDDIADAIDIGYGDTNASTERSFVGQRLFTWHGGALADNDWGRRVKSES